MASRRSSVKSPKTKLVAPDGGWGWVVLAAAMVVNFLVPGTVKSFGVLFVEFLRVFEVSPTDAAWIPAIAYCLYSSLGPVSSMLSTRYSYRIVTFIGGAFAASGLMLSYFADSITYLYISYGLMVGIGVGLTFPASVFIVTAYFDRLRGVANGLVMSGSAIGTIVLPPFLQFLLDNFGYRGAVLIMGGLILNTVVCSLLYHPVEEHMRKVPIETNEETKVDEIIRDDTNGKDKSGIENPALTMGDDESTCQDDKSCQRRRTISKEQGRLSHASSIVTIAGGMELPQLRKIDIDSKEIDSVSVKTKSKERKCFLDLSILRDPIFLVVLMSNLTTAISNTNFMILLPSYAVSQGFSPDRSAILLSIVSFLDLIGRISGASISDIDCIPKCYYFIGGVGISGVALALLPMANSYAMLAFFCGFFGLASGVYLGMTAVIWANMLGIEKFTSSYGISLFINGIIQLIGPPIINLIFEKVGSYKPIFFGLGIILIFGAVVWIAVPFIRRNRNDRALCGRSEPI